MIKSMLILLGACLASTLYAQNNNGADDQAVIVYKVKPGDTFSKIAQKYLVQPVDLAVLQRSKLAKDLSRLPVGFEIEIPRKLVKRTPSKAVVMVLSCANAIRVSDSSTPLTMGANVQEGAVIDVPAECHVALLLEDGSIIRLPSSATLKITTLRKNALEAAPEVRLDLQRGRVELEVYKGRSKATPFEIRTPLSIMGVRGTEFRVGYSPEDQAALVEVLGGVVQARGASDQNPVALTKGLGMPIDNTGKSLAVEHLLDAPTIKSIDPTSSAKPSYVVRLNAVDQALYYIADSSRSANLSGARLSQHLLAPELFIRQQGKQAVFYQFSSASSNGLVGTERSYAFCAAPGELKDARCNTLFETPLSDGAPIAFSLLRHDEDVAQPIVNVSNLRARKGRFLIQGLPAGNYSWTLVYSTRPVGDNAASDTVIRQYGAFELMVLSVSAP